MKSHQIPPSTTPLLSLGIGDEADIVSARQRARQVAMRLGLSLQDQARLATAVSEIARNAFQYAGSGHVEFSIDLRSQPQVLWVEVSDKGPGIGNLDRILQGAYESPTGMGIGLSGTRRLMDHFQNSLRAQRRNSSHVRKNSSALGKTDCAVGGDQPLRPAAACAGVWSTR